MAHQAPIVDQALLRLAAPLIYQQAMGIDWLVLPLDPIQLEPTYQLALSAFEKVPEVRVLFDNGAGRSALGTMTPGDPYPAFGRYFSTLPVPGTVAERWYLGAHGTLGGQPPASPGVDTYTSNAHALPLTDYIGNTGDGGLWANASAWHWNWEQNPLGTAVSYVSAPLATTTTTVVGAGAVHVWVRSSTPNVDLQATVSEVWPDGREVFVQNGWVRASDRQLATTSNDELAQPSTLLTPVLDLRSSAVRAMPPGRFVEVVIPLYYEGHVYRAGSRIRVTIAAPNGTQPVWSFSQTAPKGPCTVSVAFSPTMPPSLVLPVVPGVRVPTGLLPCPSLRNEPCRVYVPFVNRGA